MRNVKLETMCVKFRSPCENNMCMGLNTECSSYSEGEVEVTYKSFGGDVQAVKIIKDIDLLRRTEDGPYSPI